MMTVRLRPAVKDDGELILSTLRETRLPAADLDSDVAKFFVAEVCGEAVGIAGFEFYGDDALLRSVAVRTGAQRRGLGSEIVDLMLAEARKRSARSVVLLTETAKEFFLKKGFSVVDRSAVDNVAMKNSSEFTHACPTSAVCMRISLS